jgi:hypothetical protein
MSVHSRQAAPPEAGRKPAGLARKLLPFLRRRRSGRTGTVVAAAGALVLALLFASVGPVHAEVRSLPCADAAVSSVPAGEIDSAADPLDDLDGADGQCAAGAAERARGLAVVGVALSELGTPYAWGGGNAEGPTVGFCDGVNGYLDGVCQADHTVGFDCSGLALYSWYQASGGAISLPHQSRLQSEHGRHLERSELIPGDLLFFAEPGGPIHHVGIYLGNGAMIHAEHTGTVVRVLDDVFDDPTWGPRYVGATRPAP